MASQCQTLMSTECRFRASAHISGQNDALVDVDPLLSIIKGDWRDFLGQRLSPTKTDDIRKHAQTGRPLGDERFVTRLECLLGRELRPRNPVESQRRGVIDILSPELISTCFRPAIEIAFDHVKQIQAKTFFAHRSRGSGGGPATDCVEGFTCVLPLSSALWRIWLSHWLL